MSSEKKERDYSIDILRIFCCISIIMLHESGLWYEHQFSWSSIQSIVRPCLFAFTAISGYFLLNSNIKSYKDFYLKHFFRLILPLFIYIFLQTMYTNYLVGGTAAIFNGINFRFFYDLLTGTNWNGTHLWFVYNLIGLYLITPFLKKMLDNLKNKDIIILLGISFFFGGINPILEYYGVGFMIEFLTQGAMIFYFILGYLLSRFKYNWKYGIIITLLEIINILSILFFFRSYIPIQSVLYTFSLNMIIGILFYFYIFNLVFKNLPKILNKISKFISDRTYSIYIIHMIVLQEINKTNLFVFTRANWWYEIPLAVLIIFLISLVITSIVDVLVVSPLRKLLNFLIEYTPSKKQKSKAKVKAL